MAKKENIEIKWDPSMMDFTPTKPLFTPTNPVDALAVVNKYTANRLYDGKMITGYGYCYNGKTYVTESDAPPHLVNWHEVANDTVQLVAVFETTVSAAFIGAIDLGKLEYPPVDKCYETGEVCVMGCDDICKKSCKGGEPC